MSGHPQDVRTLVAHEPPLAELLPDREAMTAAIEDTHQTYQREGVGAGMVKFIVLASHDGQMAPDFTFPPADPAQFGLPTEDDGSRDDPLLGQNLRGCTSCRPDIDALRAAVTRVLPARGEGSGQTMAARAADALAAALGTEAVSFPGDHAGFLGGEYGQQGVPGPFAARLRQVLAGSG